MTYDEWKARDEVRERGDEPRSWCSKCEHAECDCPCCTEPLDANVSDEGDVPHGLLGDEEYR